MAKKKVATKKIAKKVTKKVTKKVAKKVVKKSPKPTAGESKPVTKRTERVSGLKTRSPSIRLAYAIGEKVYLKPGKVYTTVVNVYFNAETIRYHCATGAPVTADQLELASDHKRRGMR